MLHLWPCMFCNTMASRALQVMGAVWKSLPLMLDSFEQLATLHCTILQIALKAASQWLRKGRVAGESASAEGRVGRLIGGLQQNLMESIEKTIICNSGGRRPLHRFLIRALTSLRTCVWVCVCLIWRVNTIHPYDIYELLVKINRYWPDAVILNQHIILEYLRITCKNQ